MSDIPTRASAVVIGAGIVGNSLVHHLALLAFHPGAFLVLRHCSHRVGVVRWGLG